MWSSNWIKLLLVCLLAGSLAFAGCGGGGSHGNKNKQAEQDDDDGIVTAYDIAVINGFEGTEAQYEAMIDGVEIESCSICHSGIGDEHQEVYDDYADTSTLELTIDDVVSVDNGDGTFDATMTFTIEKDGLAYLDADGLPSLNQKRYYAVTYDSTTGMYDNSKSFSNPITLGSGQYSVTASGITYAPELSDAQVYAYIADGVLDVEGMSLYDDVASASMAWGDADVDDPDAYESTANVAGCEKCHGAPYMKHGYRVAAVDGLPDFAACKSCHYDTRSGGHEDESGPGVGGFFDQGPSQEVDHCFLYIYRY